MSTSTTSGAPRTFKNAVLSDWQKTKPVVNVRGEQLYASWNDIFTNQVWASGVSMYRFNDSAYTGTVWTGTKLDGTWDATFGGTPSRIALIGR